LKEAYKEMKKILTATQMKECDHSTIAMGTPSAVLMERAARAVFNAIIDKYDLSNTLVVCGSGNNGGD
jgi:NAD(P)H-hydrate epimerase